MTRTDELLVDLVRRDLRGGVEPVDTYRRLTESQWKELYDFASRQGVLAIVYDALSSLPQDMRPPRKIQMSWIYNIDRIEHTYAVQKFTAAQLIRHLKEYKIKVMLLKGLGLSFYYRKPNHRECGDIDIWLYGHRSEADEILQKDLGIDIRCDNPHHSTFTINGIAVENHNTFIDLQARQHREIEDVLRYLADKDNRAIDIGGSEAYIPSPTFNAIYLLRHMAVHFAAVSIGLRHLVDWALFVENEGADVDWKKVREISERQGMERFADAVNALTVDKLGLDADIPNFIGTRNEEIERRIFDDILHPRYYNVQGSNLADDIRIRILRRLGNRWKHDLVYRDSFVATFIRSAVANLRILSK